MLVALQKEKNGTAFSSAYSLRNHMVRVTGEAARRKIPFDDAAAGTEIMRSAIRVRSAASENPAFSELPVCAFLRLVRARGPFCTIGVFYKRSAGNDIPLRALTARMAVNKPCLHWTSASSGNSKMIFNEPADNSIDEPALEPRTSEVSQPEPASPLTVQVTAPDKAFFPDLDKLHSVVLKDGPRSRKTAKYSVIRSRHTGEVHHAALSIQTYRKKAGAWGYDRDHTITLSTEGEDEIQKLTDFLHTVHGGAVPRETPEPIGVPAPAATPAAATEHDEHDKHEAVATILQTLSASSKAHLLAHLLRDSAHPDSAHPDGVQEVPPDHVGKDARLLEAAAALKVALAAIESALGHPPQSQAAGQVSQQTAE